MCVPFNRRSGNCHPFPQTINSSTISLLASRVSVGEEKNVKTCIIWFTYGDALVKDKVGENVQNYC